MRCAACQADNPPGHRFCEQCGKPLVSACPGCGASTRPGARFCGNCGHALGPAEPGPGATPAPPPVTPADSRASVSASPPAAPSTGGEARPASYTPKHLAEKILTTRGALEGERRVVTVLFADMAGFTSIAERLDPEEVHSIVDRCFEVITAEVHRFEGTVNQYTGDGVMALFGAPIAHEDAPRRALHAALGIQRAMGEVSREIEASGGAPIRMRIGINTGPVVVGRIGDDLRMDYTAVGDTTNLAARLQQVAEPSRVVASETTWKAASEYFEARDLGLVSLKGRAPARAWQVDHPRRRRARFDTAARDLAPLVGRDREISGLIDLFALARSGRGQVVLVAGEPGIGKSRLLLELRQSLAQRNEALTWIEGRCVSFGQSIAFLPLIEQLRESFGIEEFDGEPEIIAKVEHAMRRMGQLEAHIPFLRFLLSVDAGDPAVAHMDPQLRRRRTFEALRAITLRSAALRPLVLVVEDLHWVDASTEEYLEWLVDSLAGAPVTLLLTHRTGYAPPFASRSFLTSITLRSLSEGQALTLAKAVLGGSDFPPELAAALMQKAEGVPLFIEEVVKALLDLGVIIRENGAYRMAKALTEVNVPDTIQGIIMARLDRLGDDGKRAVQMASVIGRQFLVRLLDRVSGLTDRLDGLLGELKALEIIYEAGLLPEPAYVFKHAVIQDVAYGSLLRERRRDLHRTVGDAIEELYPARLAEHYEELAHHYLSGEQWAKAFDYLVRSGDKARLAHANQAALDFYAKALEVAPRLSPPPPSREIGEIYHRRGLVLLTVSRFTDVITEYEGMLRVAQAAGDRQAEGTAWSELGFAHMITMRPEHLEQAKACAHAALAAADETGDRAVRAKALARLGIMKMADGDLAAGEASFSEALALAEPATPRDVAVIAEGYSYLGASAHWRGDFRQAITHAERGESVARDGHESFYEIFSLAFACLDYIGLGEHARAIEVIDRGLALSRDRHNIWMEGRLINSLGWLHQEVGDFRRARELDEQSAEIGRASRVPNVEISALINLGYDQLHLGEPERALALMEETLERVDTVGLGVHRWRWSNHLSAYLAEALLAVGQHDRARREAEQCLAKARATGAKRYLAKGHVLRGGIALVEERWSAAETDLEEALRIARQIEHPTLVWQAAHALATALAGQAEAGGAASEARLRRAHELLTLAATTIRAVEARLPQDAMRRRFLGWSRVEAVFSDLERLRHRT